MPALLALWILLLSQAALFSQSDSQHFQIGGTTVTIRSALSVTTKSHNTLYQVRLEFQSTDKSASLVGIGPMIGSGELTLLLSEPKLAFRKADNTTVDMKVTVTGATAGAGDPDLPALADFPVGNTYECRCRDESEQLRLVRQTLATFFFEGVQPQTQNAPYRVITRFHDLGMASPVLGKVAVSIEYPVVLEQKQIGYRVSWIPRESRIKSPDIWIDPTGKADPSDKAVLSKAEEYVKKVISRLQE